MRLFHVLISLSLALFFWTSLQSYAQADSPPPTPSLSELYSLTPDTTALLRNSSSGDCTTDDIRKFLVNNGVSVGTNVFVCYSAGLNGIIITAPEVIHTQCRRLFESISEEKPSVRIEVRFLETTCDLVDDIEACLNSTPNTSDQGNSRNSLTFAANKGLTTGGILDTTKLAQLMASSSGIRQLSSPNVAARCGTQATIKVVRELIYPMGYKLEKADAFVDPSTGITNLHMGTILVPEFVTRETGVILDVEPDIAPDGKAISLELNPRIVSIAGWTTNTVPVIDAKGRVSEFEIVQPMLDVRSLTSNVFIGDGQTIIMGGLSSRLSKPKPRKSSLFSRRKSPEVQEKTLVILVTAQFIDRSGLPSRQKQGDNASNTK